MEKLRVLLESRRFEYAIMVLIVINAIVLGLETDPRMMARFGGFMAMLDTLILVVFTVELIARLFVYRLSFWKDPWRVFDFVIVAIALLPTSGSLSVLRALRILRVLRLISVVPSLRRVVGGLIAALPGIGSITMLLSLVFYVFSVMATSLYGTAFPEWFGSLGASAYSLFQIMTLESWSMGIVRPVMDSFPFAWVFFIIFILCTSFTVLNLFIGIIVSAMQAEHEGEASQERHDLQVTQQQILDELAAIRSKLNSQ